MADEMRRQQAADLLFHKDGEVSELTRSNIFIFSGDKLITSDRNILNGITRRVVLELAASDFEIEVRPVTYREVVTADEIFTTSTTKWVMPVVQIGELPVADGLAGKRTLFLQEKFKNLIAGWGR